MFPRLVALLILGSTAFAQTPIFSQIDDMLRTLSDITGWRVQRTVPAEVLTNQEVRRYVTGGVR